MRPPRFKNRVECEFPSLIYIASYQSPQERSKRSEPHPTEDEVVERISSRFKAKVISKEYPLLISIRSNIFKISRMEDEDSRTYIVSVFSKSKGVKKKNMLCELDEHSSGTRLIIDTLPSNPNSVLTITTGITRGLKDVPSKLQELSRLHDKPIASAGIVGDHVVATLKQDSARADGYRRNLVFLSFEGAIDGAIRQLYNFIEGVARYASLAGRLVKLFRDRATVLEHIESSERNTQERVQDILGNVRRPPDQIEPSDLGAMLTEVSGIFSRLTTITGSVKRDHIAVKRYLHRIESQFNTWNEKPVTGYPTNSSVETRRFEEMVNFFGDNVDRLEALRTQLDTLLDTIRTYVGIQQQNVSVEEQRDTKKLVARMVTLQEVLHKLEILIVAFYITEMGRLVFEAVAHDMVDVLTVAFIPIALLLAIGIRRLLHRER